MHITTFPAAHRSSVLRKGQRSRVPSREGALPCPVSSADELFQNACFKIRRTVTEHLQSSFKSKFSYQEENKIYSAPLGLFDSCARAYFEHHHLVLRPEDVWFAILTQLNMYILGHAEELRSKFVAHEGQKALSIAIRGQTGNLQFGDFVQRMTEAMQENLLDEGLKDWIMPNFSTTTESDKIVASIIFMGAMSKYFTYDGATGCGLPSVKLLGEKEDWEKILMKIDKVKDLGDEPTKWHELLVPVLKRFVATFDAPCSMEVKDFWQRILHHLPGGSGQPDYYSGWLAVFSFWSSTGVCIYEETPPPREPSKLEKKACKRCYYVKKKGAADPSAFGSCSCLGEGLTLDDVRYGRIPVNSVVQGWISVDVRIDDTYYGNGIYMTKMVAGSVGMEFQASGDHGEGLDTVKPLTGWWVYMKPEDPEEMAKSSIGGNSSEQSRQEANKSIEEARHKVWAEIEVDC